MDNRISTQWRHSTVLLFLAILTLWMLSLDALQPDGAPVAGASQRTIHFAGREWYVKAGTGLGPGNNNWSDDPRSVWVDEDGKLHLRIRNVSGTWYSAQVNSTDLTDYGRHRFYVDTALDDLDEHVVAALFLYGDDQHELDIEFTRRGHADGLNAKYAVQPYVLAGHRESFTVGWDGPTVHEIEWMPDSVRFSSFREHDPGNSPIHQWVYLGDHSPEPRDNLRIQINLWLARRAPADGREVELVISDVIAPMSPAAR